MDVAFASQVRVAGRMNATRVVRDARPPQIYCPKSLHTSGHGQLHREPSHVPMIDLAQISTSATHNPTLMKAALAEACNEWGFFQVINHGVSQELVERFRAQCLDLFSLPMERKAKAQREDGALYGYSFRPNTGPSEVFLVPGWDESVIADYGRKLYPDSNPQSFCVVYEELNAALRKLAITIFGLVIEGLGVSPERFAPYMNEAEGSIGARYYHRSHEKDGIFGLHAHVDWNLISIVHQHEVGGLQVLKDDEWYSIPPRLDSFAVNVGDCLQALTNGKLRSVQHRVITSEAKPRLSTGYFLNPPESTTLVPVSEFVDSCNPPLYKPFTWSEIVEAQIRRPLMPSALAHFEAK